MTAAFARIRTLRVDGTPHGAEPPSARRVSAAVSAILGTTPLCAWSTVAPDGSAHVNIGYFAHSEALHLYLLSHPQSQHCRNVAVNPTMAVAVFASEQTWTEPGRGMQLFGTCAQVPDAESADAGRVYGRRYGAYAEWRAALRAGDPALEYRFYRFVPDRVKILDEAEFGDAVFVTADIVRNP